MTNKVCIGIITPSFWPGEYFTQRVERAIKNANDLWYKIKFWTNALKSSWYVSSDISCGIPKDLFRRITVLFLLPE